MLPNIAKTRRPSYGTVAKGPPKLTVEVLEPRILLDGDAISFEQYSIISPAWFAEVTSEAEASLTQSSAHDSLQMSRWVVRFAEGALSQARTVDETKRLLANENVDLKVVRGLGLPGQVLIEGPSSQVRAATTALENNPSIAYYHSINAVTAVGDITPNDPDFEFLSNMRAIAAPTAWETWCTSSLTTCELDSPDSIVVGKPSETIGLIDSGIDYTHPDLYQNIWINQGEIPSVLMPPLGPTEEVDQANPNRLRDVDGDGLITFRDLNFRDVNGAHPNQGPGKIMDRVDDNNSYIDAGDLLRPVKQDGTGGWEDGVDNDGGAEGKFKDDLVGWNFVEDNNDPWDDHGHGTAVAGILGATGNDGVGIAGVTWASSLIPVKILDANKFGSSDDVILSLHYMSMLNGNPESKVNTRLTNNSYANQVVGLPEEGVRSAIEKLGDQGILFVGASGNGGATGADDDRSRPNDNDRNRVYPASYDLDNIISVTGTDEADQVVFNFGRETVDLAAPGVFVYSASPGDRDAQPGNYGFLDGTSAAVPHVTGTAALLASMAPFASASEIKAAVLMGVDQVADSERETATGGRLNADQSLKLDTIAPRAQIELDGESQGLPTLESATSAPYQFSVLYRDNSAVDISTIGLDDVYVTRGIDSEIFLPVQFTIDSAPDRSTVSVTYSIAPTDGEWGPDDNDRYRIFINTNSVFDDPNALFEQPAGVVRQGVVPVDPNADGSLSEFQVAIEFENQPIEVTNTNDGIDVEPGDGICAAAADAIASSCTLRAAIMEAVALGGSQTILLSDETYDLTLAAEIDEGPRSGDLDIAADANVRIIGVGSDRTTIKAQNGLGDRVFHIRPGARAVFSKLGITGGTHEGIGNGGGGILNEGRLILRDIRLHDNEARCGLPECAALLGSSGGGAIFNSRTGQLNIDSSYVDNNASDTQGGAIVNLGSLDVTRTTIAGNRAQNSGAIANAGALTIRRNSVVHDNTAAQQAGAVWNFVDVLSIQGSEFTNNRAGRDGGAIRNDGQLDIFSGTRIANNAAGMAGGGIDNNGVLRIHGRLPGAPALELVDELELSEETSGRLSITNNRAQVAGAIRNTSFAAIEGADVTSNGSVFGAGAIENSGTLLLQESTIENNSVEQVGAAAIRNLEGGNLTIQTSNILQNRAQGRASEGDGFLSAGALLNEGTAAVFQSTLANNMAPEGAGIYNTADLRVSLTTISGNTATLGGGALFNGSQATARISSSTITANRSDKFRGGGVFAQINGRLAIGNTIVAQNSGITDPDVCVVSRQRIGLDPGETTCVGVAESVDANGVINQLRPMRSLGSNLVGDAGTAGAFFELATQQFIEAGRTSGLDQFGTAGQPLDAKLGELRNNHGFFHTGFAPLTQLPSPDSRAVDSGQHLDNLNVDQRGVETPQGIARDVGAVESGFFGDVHGVKFHDIDGDGIRDADEPSLAGWTIYLDLNQDGNRDANEPNVTTSEDGSFEFRQLPPDTYVLREVMMPAWRATTGGGHRIALKNGQVLRVDLGSVADRAEIRGTVFHDDVLGQEGMRDLSDRDEDGDGELDPVELGLSDWKIRLLDERGQPVLNNDGEEIVAFSNASGAYRFQDILPGNYIVGEDLETRQTVWRQTLPTRAPGKFVANGTDPGTFPGMIGWQISDSRTATGGHDASNSASYYSGLGGDQNRGGRYPIARDTLTSQPIDLRTVTGRVELEFSSFLDISSSDTATLRALAADGTATVIADTVSDEIRFDNLKPNRKFDLDPATSSTRVFVSGGQRFEIVDAFPLETDKFAVVRPAEEAGGPQTVVVNEAALRLDFPDPINELQLQLHNLSGPVILNVNGDRRRLDRAVDIGTIGMLGDAAIHTTGSSLSSMLRISGHLEQFEIGAAHFELSGLHLTKQPHVATLRQQDQLVDILEDTRLFVREKVSLSQFAGQEIRLEFLVDSTQERLRTEVATFVVDQQDVDARNRYFVEVEGFDQDSTHEDYALTITGPDIEPDRFDEAQRNDTLQSPTFLEGVGLSGSVVDQVKSDLSIDRLNGNPDVDWFAFRAASTDVEIDVLFSHALGDLDLTLYGPDFEPIAESRSRTDNESVSFDQLEPAAAYYVRVVGFKGATNPNYELVIHIPGPDRLEVNAKDIRTGNNTFATAVRQSADGVACDDGDLHCPPPIFTHRANRLGGPDFFEPGLSIHGPLDRDLFRLIPQDDGQLEVTVLFDDSHGDLTLALFEGTQEVAVAGTASVGVERIAHEVKTGETYYVEVLGVSTSRDISYDLLINTPGDPFGTNSSLEDAHDLGSFSAGIFSQSGLSISQPGQADYFVFQPTSPGVFEVELEYDSAEGDVVASVIEEHRRSTTEAELSSVTRTRREGWFVDDVDLSATGEYDVELSAGQVLEGLDFANQLEDDIGPGVVGVTDGVIAGSVFVDVDGDGMLDGLVGNSQALEVQLREIRPSEGGQPATQIVDTIPIGNDGSYRFDQLTRQRVYEICVVQLCDDLTTGEDDAADESNGRFEASFPLGIISRQRTDIDRGEILDLTNVRTLTFGHFNSDECLDVAMGHTQTGAVLVALASQSLATCAGFETVTNVDAGIRRIAERNNRGAANTVVSVDADGRFGDDLVVLNLQAGAVDVLKNTAGGEGFTFDPTPDRDRYVLSETRELVAIGGDFNDDTRTDVAVVDKAGRLTILWNNAPGAARDFTIEHVADLAIGEGTTAVLAVPIDQDANVDLAILQNERVLLFRNNPEAATRFEKMPLELNAGERPLAIAAGNIDGDPLMDLVVANDVSGQENIRIFRNVNNIDVDQAPAEPTTKHFVDAKLKDIAVLDVNSDGAADLLLATEPKSFQDSLGDIRPIPRP